MSLFHKHKWDIVSSQKAETSFLGKGSKDVTIVLYLCPECKMNKTETFLGLWTTEELRGE